MFHSLSRSFPPERTLFNVNQASAALSSLYASLCKQTTRRGLGRDTSPSHKMTDGAKSKHVNTFWRIIFSLTADNTSRLLQALNAADTQSQDNDLHSRDLVWFYSSFLLCLKSKYQRYFKWTQHLGCFWCYVIFSKIFWVLLFKHVYWFYRWLTYTADITMINHRCTWTCPYLPSWAWGSSHYHTMVTNPKMI